MYIENEVWNIVGYILYMCAGVVDGVCRARCIIQSHVTRDVYALSLSLSQRTWLMAVHGMNQYLTPAGKSVCALAADIPRGHADHAYRGDC